MDLRMEITFTKTHSGCKTSCIRPNGSVVAWESPNNGELPHDIVHWIVESELGLHNSFYGNIALGQDDFSVNELASKDSELAKTEKLVLLIQADMAIRDGKLYAEPTAMRGLYGLKYPHSCKEETIGDLIALIDDAVSDWKAKSTGEQLHRTFL